MDHDRQPILRWQALAYHAVRDSLVEGSDLEEIIGAGADFEGEPDEIVAAQDADTDYGVGYHAGRPCLFDTGDGGYGFYVDAGTVYEQRYGGFAWEVVQDE
jgi:hypothetical protein